MGFLKWITFGFLGADPLLNNKSITRIKSAAVELKPEIKGYVDQVVSATSIEELVTQLRNIPSHGFTVVNLVLSNLDDEDKKKYSTEIMAARTSIYILANPDTRKLITGATKGPSAFGDAALKLFKDALSTTSAANFNPGPVSETSAVPVSTVRPPAPQTGGFTYTRNRYQQYEDKIKALTGGANDANTNNDDPNKLEEGPAELAEQAAEVSKELEKATADLMKGLDSLDVKPNADEPKTAEPNLAQSGQSGGMELDNIDREISNIRDFLLSTKNAQNAQNQSGGSYLLSDIAGSEAMDLNLRAIRDNLLNANYSATSEMGMNMVGGANFSATSSDMAFNNNGNQLGGNLSATSSDMAFNNNGNQLGGNLSATSPFSDLAQNQDLVGGSNLNYSVTSDVPVNYDMLMGGAKANKNGKNGKDSKTTKKEKDSSSTHSSSCSTSEEDSDKSTSTDHKSSSDTDSTPSGTEIGIDASDFVGSSDADLNASDLKRLQRGVDKRQNRSNFLRGDYVLTSNSDKNYAVNGRPYFSSQSSEYQNGVASEFLKNMRTRSRS